MTDPTLARWETKMRASVYEGMTTFSRVLARLPQGYTFLGRAVPGGWIERANGGGYVRKDRVRVSGDERR